MSKKTLCPIKFNSYASMSNKKKKDKLKKLILTVLKKGEGKWKSIKNNPILRKNINPGTIIQMPKGESFNSQVDNHTLSIYLRCFQNK